jgi:hypothetical protein
VYTNDSFFILFFLSTEEECDKGNLAVALLSLTLNIWRDIYDERNWQTNYSRRLRNFNFRHRSREKGAFECLIRLTKEMEASMLSRKAHAPINFVYIFMFHWICPTTNLSVSNFSEELGFLLGNRFPNPRTIA